MAGEERRIPAPRIDPELKPYWDAAREGRLLVKRCRACGAVHYFPRALCPFCLSAETEWLAATGRGVIYSYSIARRPGPPYAIAYVTLDEGVTIMTNIVDCDLDKVAIGAAVRVVFKPSDGGPPVPMFTPS
jgi:uncharacterized OB-fold protein